MKWTNVTYAVLGSNRVFNVALRRTPLPTPGLSKPLWPTQQLVITNHKTYVVYAWTVVMAEKMTLQK